MSRQRTQARAAKVLFAGSMLFLAGQLIVQLVEHARRSGRARPPGNGPETYFHTTHNAHGLPAELLLMALWAVACVSLILAFYQLLKRLGPI